MQILLYEMRRATCLDSVRHKFFLRVCRYSTNPDVDLRAKMEEVFLKPHPKCNVTSTIRNKIGQNLHLRTHHPLNIIKQKIEEYCKSYARTHYSKLGSGYEEFRVFDQLSPLVHVKHCFDDLRVPSDHVSRSSSDTYYIDETTG